LDDWTTSASSGCSDSALLTAAAESGSAGALAASFAATEPTAIAAPRTVSAATTAAKVTLALPP